jgi:hypothetical protein
MDDVLAMRIVERGRDGESVTDCFVDGQLILACEPLTQRLPLDVRHHVVEKSLDLAGIEQRENVGMIEAGDDFDLAEKALWPDGFSQSGVKNLQRDDALVFGILRQADSSHAAPTELAVDGVRGSEQLPDALDGQNQATIPRRDAVVRDDSST